MAPPDPFWDSVNTPGEYRAILALTGADARPSRVTTTDTVRNSWSGSSTDHGTCTLICVSDTYKIGAAAPSIVTETPPKLSGSGDVLAVVAKLLRPVPTIVASEPGASVAALEASKLAALTTRLATGCANNAAGADMTKKA